MNTAHATSAIVPTYARANVAFERGEGCWLVSTEGERYLDFGAGIAVTSVGHAHPHLVEALTSQGSKLWHVSNLYQNPEGERFARRLVDATFADLVFFANSGAEANEAAVKMARRRHSIDGHPERYRTLTFEGAFHGRTLAMIAAGGQAKYLDGFGPKVDGFDQIPLTDLAAVEAAIGPGTGSDHDRADPGRGRGAARSARIPARLARDLRPAWPCADLRRSADRRRPDRAGFYAYEHCGIHPDILTSAKGIGGGLSDVGVSGDRGRRSRPDRRRPRHDVRRQSAGDGGRQRDARRHPRAGLPRAGRQARSGHAPAACGAQGSPRRGDRGGSRRGADDRPQTQGRRRPISPKRRSSRSCSSFPPATTSCASCRRLSSPTRRSPKACGGSTPLAPRSKSA